MKYFRYIFALAVFMALTVPSLHAKIKVVASISDLAYLAQRIGGDQVEVTNIAPPTADVHYIEARPSYMVKLREADLVLKVGLELDLWMDKLIDGSRNNSLKVIDCSQHIQALEVPTFKADARYGDLHRFGNPHYWIGPQNVPAIAQAIADGLAAADPEHAKQFADNRDVFLKEVDQLIAQRQDDIAKLKDVGVIYYHNSWPYFNEFAGLNALGFIEPYPGVAPSPSHVAEITELIRNRHIKIIAMEPYFDHRVPDKIAAATGATVVVVYPSIGGRSKDETYSDWLTDNIEALVRALP